MAINWYSSLNNSSLNSLYGNGSLAKLYAAAGGETTTQTDGTSTAAADAVDTVTLSDATPKQIATERFAAANSLGAKIASGASLTEDEIAQMQGDTAFSGMAALIAFQSATSYTLLDAMNDTNGSGQSSKASLADLIGQYGGVWPEETEAPAADDLSDVVKRLTQRLSGDAEDIDAASLDALRRGLVDLFRDADAADFSALAAALTT